MKNETINPWQTLSGKEIYDNPWIKVMEYKVINPGGGQGIYGKVSFKNLAIGIIPLDELNNTWLVGQYRYTLDAYSWEIPMGGGPMDQDALGSASRELLEETGISANSWEMVLKLHLSNSVSDEIGYVFIAKDLSYGTAIPDETEHDLKVKQMPFSKALEMVEKGEITDALSVAGILKVARNLKLQ